MIIRRARPGDASALSGLAHDAYARYVDRMGAEPAPMRADYPALVRAGAVWVAERDGGAVVGMLVLARPRVATTTLAAGSSKRTGPSITAIAGCSSASVSDRHGRRGRARPTRLGGGASGSSGSAVITWFAVCWKITDDRKPVISRRRLNRSNRNACRCSMSRTAT